jgi:hypothetical protein
MERVQGGGSSSSSSSSMESVAWLQHCDVGHTSIAPVTGWIHTLMVVKHVGGDICVVRVGGKPTQLLLLGTAPCSSAQHVLGAKTTNSAAQHLQALTSGRHCQRAPCRGQGSWRAAPQSPAG